MPPTAPMIALASDAVSPRVQLSTMFHPNGEVVCW